MCASHSSDGSDEEDSEQPNMWNVMLEFFTLWEISPRLQQALEDWEMCRVALTVPFCAGRLLISGEQRISALSLLLTRSRKQCRVLVEHVGCEHVMMDSAWPSCLFRLGDGASGA